jgi:hypothetical protein
MGRSFTVSSVPLLCSPYSLAENPALAPGLDVLWLSYPPACGVYSTMASAEPCMEFSSSLPPRYLTQHLGVWAVLLGLRRRSAELLSCGQGASDLFTLPSRTFALLAPESMDWEYPPWLGEAVMS